MSDPAGGAAGSSAERTDRRIVAVAVLASFVAFLDGSVVNLALPAISADLGGGLALQQWVLDGYLLTLGALILVAGAVSDQYGRLAVLRAGLVLFGVASVACAAAPTGWVLVAARCLQGVGAAFLVPSSLAMINSHFSGSRQARAVGTWTAWTGTAFVVGPLLGGLLVDAVGWPAIFGVNVIPLAVTLFLARGLPEPDTAGRAGGGIDVLGAVLGAAGLTGAVYALIEQQRLGLGHPTVIAGLVVGIACLTAFPLWERRAAHPMMPLHIFTQRNFAVGNLATVFLYAAVSLGPLLVALYLQEGAGLSATAAGLATLPIPLLSFLLARRFGTLAGVHGPRLFMAVGPLLGGLGFLLMARVGDPFDFWTQLLPGLVLFGLGLTMTVSPLTAAILAAVDPAQSGIGSAVNNAVSRIAGLVAVALTGVIVGANTAGVMDAAGFRRGVLVTAALLAVAGLVSAVGIRNGGAVDRVSAQATAQCHDRAAPPPGHLGPR
jgi:EmrB/QacA subfamily drug resistance transporter